MSTRSFRFDTSAYGTELPEVRCAQLSPVSRRFAVSGHREQQLFVWSLSDKAVLLRLLVPGSEPASVAFSEQEDYVFAGCSGGSILAWDVSREKLVCTLSSHRAACNALAACARSQRTLLASGSQDCTVKLWDLRKKYCAHTFRGHESPLTTLAFSTDGKSLASGCEDGSIIVWDCAASKKLLQLRSAAKGVVSLQFSPTHMALAAAFQDSVLQTWDLDTQLSHSAAETGALQRVCFHSQSAGLVLAALDGAARVWELKKGLIRDSVATNWHQVADVCYEGDRGVLMALSYDREGLEAHFIDFASLHIASVDTRRRKEAPEPVSVSAPILATVQEEHRAVVLLLGQRCRTLEELATQWEAGEVLQALQRAEQLKDHSILAALLEGFSAGSVQVPLDASPQFLELCTRLIDSKYEAFVAAAIKTVAFLLKLHSGEITAQCSCTLHRLSPQRRELIQRSEFALQAFLRFRSGATFALTCTRSSGMGQAAKQLQRDLDALAAKCLRWAPPPGQLAFECAVT